MCVCTDDAAATAQHVMRWKGFGATRLCTTTLHFSYWCLLRQKHCKSREKTAWLACSRTHFLKDSTAFIFNWELHRSWLSVVALHKVASCSLFPLISCLELLSFDMQETSNLVLSLGNLWSKHIWNGVKYLALLLMSFFTNKQRSENWICSSCWCCYGNKQMSLYLTELFSSKWASILISRLKTLGLVSVFYRRTQAKRNLLQSSNLKIWFGPL